MGHQRLGKLPAHRLLPEIVRYLVLGGAPTKDLVDQVTEVGRDALKRNDAVVGFTRIGATFWQHVLTTSE